MSLETDGFSASRADILRVREQVAVSSVAFEGHSWEAIFETLAAIGFRQVEIAFIEGYVSFEEADFSAAGSARLRQALAGAGLTCLVMSAHIDFGTTEAVEKMQRRLSFAAEIGARMVVTNTASRADKIAFVSNVAACLPLAESMQIVIALENQGHGEDILFDGAASGRALAELFGTRWLGLNYDACNAYTYSFGRLRPDVDIAEIGARLVRLHLKDVAEIGDDWAYCPLGNGVIDVREVLQRTPQGTPLTIELPLRISRPSRGPARRSPDPLPLFQIQEAIERSTKYLAATIKRDRGH